MDQNLRVRLTLEAVDRMASPLKGIDAAADRVRKTMRVLQDQKAALSRSMADVSSFRATETALELNSTALAKARERNDRLAASWQAASQPTQKLARDYEAAGRELARLEQLQDRHQSTLAEVTNRLQAAGASTKDLTAHENRLQGELRQTNVALDAQRDALKRVNDQRRNMEDIRGQRDRTLATANAAQSQGINALGAGAAMAAPAIIAGRNAAELQSGVTTIAQRSDMTQAAARVYEQRLLEMARRNNLTRQEATELLDELTAQGTDPTRALTIADAVGRATVAYRENSREMAQAAGSMKNLGLEASDTTRAFDIMAAAGKAGNFEFGAMARAFPSLTAQAAAFGMTGPKAVAELAAAGQIARRGAGSDEEAATNLQNVLQKIGSPQTARNFAKLGINLREELQRGEKAGVSALETIIELSKRATGGDASLLGTLFEDAQVQAGLRPLMSATADFRKIRDDALKASGTVDRDFERRMLDAGEAAKRLKIAGDSLGVTFGAQLLPDFQKGAEMATRISDRFNAWAKANPALSGTLAKVFIGLAAVLFIFGALALVVSAVLAPFALLQFSLAGTSALLAGTGMAAGGSTAGIGAFSLAMRGAATSVWAFMAPLLPIIAVIAILAGAAFLIYRNWGPITRFFGGLWTGIKSAVVGGIGQIMSFLRGWAPAQAVAGAWNGVTTWLAGFWTRTRSVVAAGVAGAGQAILDFTPLGAIVRNWSAITGFFGAIWTLAKEVVGLGLDSIRLALLTFTPLGMIVRNWSTITGFFGRLWSGVREGVGAFFSTVAGLIDRYHPVPVIIRNWGQITGAIGGVWTSVRSTIDAGIAAALGLVMQFTPLGAIVRNWSAITTWLTQFWTGVRSGVTTAIGSISTAIRSWSPLVALRAAFASTFDWLKRLPAHFLTAGTDMVNGMINGIRGRRAEVAAASTQATRGTVTAARQTAQIRSPSRVFARIGDELMTGLSMGITRTQASPIGRMRRATAALAGAAGVALSPAAIAPAVAGSAGEIPIGASARPTATTTPTLPTLVAVLGRALGQASAARDPRTSSEAATSTLAPLVGSLVGSDRLAGLQSLTSGFSQVLGQAGGTQDPRASTDTATSALAPLVGSLIGSDRMAGLQKLTSSFSQVLAPRGGDGPSSLRDWAGQTGFGARPRFAMPDFAPTPTFEQGPRLGSPAAATSAQGGLPGAGGGRSARARVPMSITINVYGAPGQDVRELAEETRRRIEELQAGSSDEAVYADDGYGE